MLRCPLSRKTAHPLGQGSAEDVAHGCVNVLLDAARSVKGTELMADGRYATL